MPYCNSSKQKRSRSPASDEKALSTPRLNKRQCQESDRYHDTQNSASPSRDSPSTTPANSSVSATLIYESPSTPFYIASPFFLPSHERPSTTSANYCLSVAPNHENPSTSFYTASPFFLPSHESLSTSLYNASPFSTPSSKCLPSASIDNSPFAASGDASPSITPYNEGPSTAYSSETLSAISGDNSAKVAPGDETLLTAPIIIRVGPQPLQAQKYIVSVLQTFAEDHINFIISKSHRGIDQRLPNTTPEMLKADAKGLFQTLKSSLCMNGNLVTRVCDYTGIPLSWSEGPGRLSLEAIYPYVVKEDRIAYHANPNVCFIAASNNMARKRHPPILLALIAAWFNSMREHDLEARQAQQTWIYNALCNVASLEHIFHLTLSHADQIARWEAWPLERQKEALEVIRTGTKDPIVDELLSGLSAGELFHSSRKPLAKTSHREIIASRSMLDTLMGIGEKYGLSREEFTTYLTIEAPGRSERVFYAFHVLSRPQAEENGWDWNGVTAFGRRLTRALKDQCNRHAEAAGYGETDLNETTMVYWMAAYFSKKIADFKEANPAAGESEILWCSMLDRWGLPMVPWVRHVLRMSLCKGPDHGIAVLLGFLPTNGEAINPPRHIDLSLRVVELDTGFTNFAMKNYAVADWH
ncbi:hypothetical protein M441DRAFT_42353 [Trichoderma asperellum CBS 433.97]|uniref:Uncharacterized protein n=1 Tax=Trichoderma asperellum (strain ATCC 204424 / CBS 433.97 / NBRC 101777) TaxID=1042311 RepID=A0A2T3ZP75_TRIA4|nr:hypothetical protein M441DRAFT_42353 [Trichoderma asperellum CBS 433.97]PTB46574.1 hypothetical protein M441DRAFT_42353 [Trichoderma asperellum CBS 433.97]